MTDGEYFGMRHHEARSIVYPPKEVLEMQIDLPSVSDDGSVRVTGPSVRFTFDHHGPAPMKTILTVAVLISCRWAPARAHAKASSSLRRPESRSLAVTVGRACNFRQSLPLNSQLIGEDIQRLFPCTVLALAIASSALSGCAVASSTKMNVQDANFGGTGIPYLLPKALVPVEVVATGTQVRVDLLEPVYVGDAAPTYALRYDVSPFSTDTMTITVDPSTSQLKTMSIESKDETGEILKKAIATLRAGSAAATETVLMQTVLDPGDPASIAKIETRVKTTLDAFVARRRAGGNAAATKPDGCTELLALHASIDTRFGVTLMATAASATLAYSNAGAPMPGATGGDFRFDFIADTGDGVNACPGAG